MSKLIATRHREGSLYYLDHGVPIHHACTSSGQKGSKGTILASQIWSLRSTRNTRTGKVKGLDLDAKQKLIFCESCAQGKNHRLPFQQSTVKRTNYPLELIHSDVCGKIGTQSLGRGEYFVTFLDHSLYVWVYILKQKSEVFQHF